MDLVDRYQALPALLADNEAWPQVAGGLTGTMIHRCDEPDGVPVRLEFTAGALEVGGVRPGELSPLEVSGPSATWSSLFAGELDAVEALTLDELHIESTTVHLVAQMGAVTVLFGVLSNLDALAPSSA